MLPRFHLLLRFGLALLLVQTGQGELALAQAQKTLQRKSNAGDDSLPADALVRLGDARFRAGGGAVQAIAFSSDDRTLISVDGYYEPGAARYWDVATGRQLREVSLARSRRGANAILSPDQQLVALEAESDVRPPADDDKPIPAESVNVIDVWELKSGRRLQRLQVPGQEPHSFCFSPDGKLLASRHTGGEIVVWSCATGQKVKQLQTPGEDIAPPSSGVIGARAALTWSPDGAVLATAQTRRPRGGGAIPPGAVVSLWNIAEGKLLERTIAFEDYCLGLTFSPDGKRLVLQGDRALVIAETATGKILRRLSVQRPGVAFSKSGKLLAVTDSRDNGNAESYVQWSDVWLVDLSTPDKPQRLPIKRHTITTLVLSHEGKTLATGSYGGEIRLWETATGKEKGGEAVKLGDYIAFSGDGKTVAAPDWSGAIHLWDAGTGREVGVLPGKHTVYGLRFSPDGRLLVSAGGQQERLCLWDVAQRKLLWPADNARWKEAHLPAFSPDGRTMAVCFGLSRNGEKDDRNIRLYSLQTGKEIRRLKGEVDFVVFSPDGKQLAGGCRTDGDLSRRDSGIRLWDVDSGKLVRAYDELREFDRWNPESLTFTPDGRQLVVWQRPRFGISHKLVELEPASGKVRWEIDAPFTSPHAFGTNVAVSPDGRIAALANAEETISLYRLDTAGKLGRLTGHRGAVVDVAFSPDGKRLASVSSDKTALIWDVSRYLERAREGRTPQRPSGQ
jgi:WD40 repeat protein